MRSFPAIVWLGVYLLFCCTFSFAGDRPLPKRSVADFLTPDGRFDLGAARSAGFEGSLDLKGYKFKSDPQAGAPLFTAAGAT